ncbi:lysylphosphatidylglycerol synthase domain-containing protein [Nocardiopsis sp. RSe5-2]|uniref:Lysylphosphatidylglycerol synthase domain-containing protein n=1 Tax=Nocardiopsis endophytica TaxID=3018445 RepID=A0ABT4U7Y6_9ACTN|nr:lysylphosphatidylglycerol synthase domain-containing protein [Nocardiopsis endophytica]MDA2812442.1 lysylphosphatidylglycerol synthase domain-containing protein [Nocardiopsis endophytica]
MPTLLARLRSDRRVRLAVLAAVLVFAAVALADRWDEARGALAALPPWALPASLVCALAALGGQMMAWRALLAGLGSPLPAATAARAMFVGQLGKYLPGSVWAFAAQVELARDHDVPRHRGAAATVQAVAVTLAANLAVAAATLPFASEEATRRWWWVLLLAPLLLAALHPRLVEAVLGTAMRLSKRPVEVRVDGRATAAALGWTLAAWIPLSLHIGTLVAGADGAGWRALPIAAGAYALAWTLGVLFVIAPAGVGVRELVLVVALSPVLTPGAALVVAALSRLVMTAADLLAAGLAGWAGRGTPAQG